MRGNPMWVSHPDQCAYRPKSYARISATPGKVQTINFYNINEELYLVDLPGYHPDMQVSKKSPVKSDQRYLHTSKQVKQSFF